MGANNFSYTNRCIVVTDEDYEFNNMPSVGEWIYGNRSYPSRKLEDSDKFDFWDIVMTSGYYEGACIDYKENDRDVEYWLGGTQYYDTKTAFFNECKSEFGLTEYRLRKICGNVGNMDIEDYLEQSYEKLTEYLREKEESLVNEYLDEIKRLYGYAEYVTDWWASNGECGYRKIS